MENQKKQKDPKVNLGLVHNIRIGGIVLLWAGCLFKVWILFGIGMFIWMGTYLYTIGKIEEKLFYEEPKDEEKDEE